MRVVYGPQTVQFFDRLFGEESLALKFQWLRAAGRGAASGIHCDAVSMGHGTRQLLTLWTPFGTIPPKMGPTVVCLGSHRWQRMVETYGQNDVDRDNISGVFSHDPAELVDRFGGQWATTTYEPGDVLILGMHLFHASQTNMANRYRISCDMRYQPASRPIDGRGSGALPMGYPVMWRPNAVLEPIEAARQCWGLSA
jgi:ectoine hydroxylase-related dioxygenase (phytanoyl-CoA dioxygenase family)